LRLERLGLSSSIHAGSWAEFLTRTPFGQASGQPPLPGARPYVPDTEQEQASTQSLPLFLRQTVPPRLTKACASKHFRRQLLDNLLQLGPDDAPPTATARKALRTRLASELLRLSPPGPPSRDSGKVDVLEQSCLHFLFSVVLPELVSPESKEKKQAGSEMQGGWDDPWDDDEDDEAEPSTNGKRKDDEAEASGDSLSLDSPLCLRSAMAARVAVGPSRTSGGGLTAKMRYSTLNGPVVRANVEQIKPKEATLPVEAASALASVLHAERNPEGNFTPRALLAFGIPEAGALEFIRQLLQLQVVERGLVQANEAELLVDSRAAREADAKAEL